MAKKRELPTLYVVQIGNDEFVRFVIEDQQDRVWTGEGFDSHGAALFAKHNDAAVESQNILRSHFKQGNRASTMDPENWTRKQGTFPGGLFLRGLDDSEA